MNPRSSDSGWTDLERRLALLWERVLASGPVGRQDDFFVLNGSSIQVIDLLGRIRAEMGVELGLQDVFRAPVLRDLAARIASAGRPADTGGASTMVHHPPRDEYPLSFAQSRLWFLEQLHPGIPAYRTITALSLLGDLQVAALQAALDGVVARHAPLRASFRARSGVPVQVIRPPAPVPLPVLDLRSHPDGDGEVRRLARDEVRKPMDLESGPLLRATLVGLDEDRHVLLLVIHHIAFDAWSRNVLVNDLAACYREGCHPGEAGGALAPLDFDYFDHILWQRSPRHADQLDADRVYWQEHLGQDPLPLELPLDLPRPPVPRFEGLRETLDVPASLCAHLKELAAAEGTTLASAILAAFLALLQRHTESDSIVLGLVVAGRKPEGTGTLVGLFVNELALRVDVAPGEAFRALLARTSEALLGAVAHQALPLDEQVRAARPGKQIHEAPLFRVAFNFKPRRVAPGSLGPWLRWAPFDVDPGLALFDLMLDVEQLGDALAIRIDYDRDLYRPATMRRLAGHLRALLDAAVATPDRTVATLPLTSEPERAAVLRVASGPWPVEEAPDLVARIEEQASRRPDHAAVEAPDGTLTYAQLESTSNRLARRLRSLGVGRESRVGVAVPRGARELCALLATLKAGAAYVPVDPGHPVERVRIILEDASPGMFVATSDSPLRGALPPGTQLLALDDLEAATAGFDDAPLDEPPDPGQLAYVLFTSGSTGRPKGVEVLRGGFANFLRSMAREPGLGEDDRFLAITTTTFDISGLELFGPLWVGATTVIADRQASMDPRLLVDHLDRGRVSILQATPATWRMLVDSGWKGTPGLRMLCGGEALSRDLARLLLDRGSELWNMYGPTETTVWSTLDRVAPGDGRITIGRPIDRTRVYLLDPDLALVPPGVVGEIFIGGDGVARGYLGRSDLTAERFVRDPFGPPGSRMYRTGDLGRLLDDDRLECLGRTDHQVKVRGFRIELGEVEAALRTVPGVREAVVVADGQGTGAPRLVAYWVGEASREALYERARDSLAPYMIPAAYAHMDAFPLTSSGKVDRKALPRPGGIAVAPSRAGPVVRPRNDAEARVASIWAHVLGTGMIGIDQDFFALGGTSLLAVRARSLIEQEFRLEVPLRAFFESPTVRSIAARLGSAADPDEPIVAWLGREPEGKPPVFCLLGIQLYQDFAEALRGVQPVVGIHVPARYRPGDSHSIQIEALAERYVAQIRAIQPRGPYHLAGFCFGGIVAYEVCRQLERMDETVAQVAIFDGGLPGGFRTRAPARVRDLGLRLLWFCRAFLGARGGRRAAASSGEAGLVDLDVTSAELRFAGRRYERTLGRIQAPIVVFRALHRAREARTPRAPDLGWSRFATRVSACVLASDHLGLVHQPQASEVAARWIAEVEARGARNPDQRTPGPAAKAGG